MLKARTVICCFAALAVAGPLAACGESPPTTTPSPVPAAPRQTGPTLTGVVFENTAQGRRPISAARVYVVDLLDGPYGNFLWYELQSDSNGRFNLPNVYPGRAVKLTGYDGPGDGLWNQSGLAQVCAVHPTIAGDTTADIELVRAGALPTTKDSPMLSGIVFETSNGRRPVAGASILYSSAGHDGADVYTRTDANGRYNFCRLPPGPGYVLAGCSNAVTPIPGFRGTRVPVEIQGDAVVDVDVTSSIGSCP